jgi:hypothetical protein
MVEKNIVRWSRMWLAAGFVMSTMLAPSAARANEALQILRGFQIAPVPLNLRGKNWTLVGLGSYIVNTTGCNDCHTHPNWTKDHNPFMGQPEQINTDQYLTGGRLFGSIVSANLTPDNTGRPAGLTRKEFVTLMRTGHDPDDPPGVLLQVMPWPLYRWKTDRELIAMYEYLSAIPSLPDNPEPGP